MARGLRMDPLRGEYGFLTQFNISEEDARLRVRHMVSNFSILEFQFYDAVEGYSFPPADDLDFWWSKAFFTPVNRNVLRAYIDEIHIHGGRSWLYVQAMATDPGDTALQKQAGVQTVGQHRVDSRPLLDVVVPTSDWGAYIAPRWAHFAASMNFSGIHWDMLGDFKARNRRVSDFNPDIAGFLRTALQTLKPLNLAQTANFVDGFGWSRSLVNVGWFQNVVAFPYWEVWTVPETEERFFQEVHAGGVFVCYPGHSKEHNQRQNQNLMGVWPVDLIIMRWQKARCRGSTYLAIGDGLRHIQSEYFPDTAELSEADVMKIQLAVSRDCVFPPMPVGPGPEPGRPSSSSQSVASVFLVLAMGILLFALLVWQRDVVKNALSWIMGSSSQHGVPGAHAAGAIADGTELMSNSQSARGAGQAPWPLFSVAPARRPSRGSELQVYREHMLQEPLRMETEAAP